MAQQRARAASSSAESNEPATPGPSRAQVHALIHSPDRSPLSSAVYVSLSPQKAPSGTRIAAEVPVTIFSALFNNGLILGLTCATVVPQRSTPAPHAPPSLQPTTLQLETVHLPWIDRFPLPRLRDNLITWEAAINEEEFLGDLFNMRSFAIKPGRAGWDPDAWTVDKDFARKWGFLLT